jgi:hypothetical protein
VIGSYRHRKRTAEVEAAESNPRKVPSIADKHSAMS